MSVASALAPIAGIRRKRLSQKKGKKEKENVSELDSQLDYDDTTKEEAGPAP